jgi:hypothetical protein
MSNPGLDLKTARESVELVRLHGSINAAARAADLPRTTLQSRLKTAEEVYSLTVNEEWGFEPPTLVDPDLPVEDLINQRIRAFERKQKAIASRTWPTFTLRESGPFALAFVGDPHMDDNGCNWKSLSHHVQLLRETPGLYGIGMGDYSNNWIGKLTQLYANQETTQSDAWRLAEWFFRQTKPSGQSIWFMLLKGNHDLWSEKKGGGDPLDWMCRGDAMLEAWRCKFEVRCGDLSWRVDAAHDHKGHSMWNTLHGPQKEAMMGEAADFYVSGDKHNWAYLTQEDQRRPGRVYHLARCRGYKHHDSYASQLGFGDQQYGGSIIAVFDTRKGDANSVTMFSDMDQAVEFLAFLRR